MAELTLDSVTKVFNDGGSDEVVAVDDLSMGIEDGEFLVLVGPSGCGKSTTLRMIAGLETVTDGEIRLGERTINDSSPADRDIAMVFQSYALYPHMTVRENMRFGLEESTDMPDDEIRSKVEGTAAMMGIEDLLDRKPSELSGGQQQRVALGRAIVRDPSAFLMDEPLSNLDAKLRATMRTELQRLQADLGVTTVYVTHDQTEAMTMGDRIAVLDDGVLQQVGTPLECYHTPNNRFVAGFIGEPSMNFFPTARSGDTLSAEQFTYPLPEAVASSLGDATEVTLGVRPEDVEVRPAVDDLGDHDFACVVDVVEPVGESNNVYLRFADAPEGETFIATISGMRNVAAGDRVGATIPPSAIHLFDDRTGAALRNRSLADVDGVTST
ncbi:MULTISPECIES: ABC transporter ATP-binding protein [Halolamina]|uniref:ABC-type D-xylose/L-arabinose transporter n=1 Tax=Halolamina pelagica TaxID=699431 RepID=A0A1I5QZV2_9EURY|nr:MULTISPECIES: sn-glycerol-3-phosphate ABC transporter ATP-binding protein UgpC [Halolamina]NHX35619.1 sn-glycerol-3-phosphate ABC transporter ATP-binding protein UgpC [Halolamina sp. R1-12]SFP51779.1 multiple sugar transport system ATP-binding protein [Halolamina pelagica]